ncbi:uncharacterized protein BDR25DRAFT_350971 [Lindgomyces ingoldianus]|uniref:Uncharacterized protein n=1 Tax=Lindgomyces ingoldianus TaxID=673940 RepID=A0ACB6R8J6_9PLEO|nr:uncharacterized protein BDR25DRAFT_350971 [Lindgomyces ingoldianus]KAF2475603.1 hypothetical protein BDR25DRAFT_350971 [Lindgomyces ingoldianus]
MACATYTALAPDVEIWWRNYVYGLNESLIERLAKGWLAASYSDSGLKRISWLVSNGRRHQPTVRIELVRLLEVLFDMPCTVDGKATLRFTLDAKSYTATTQVALAMPEPLLIDIKAWAFQYLAFFKSFGGGGGRKPSRRGMMIGLKGRLLTCLRGLGATRATSNKAVHNDDDIHWVLHGRKTVTPTHEQYATPSTRSAAFESSRAPHQNAIPVKKDAIFLDNALIIAIEYT